MKYKSGYKYQLAETISIQTCITPPVNVSTYMLNLDPNGTLTIDRGYAWDGPSGPTIDTKNTLTPSLMHDAIYQLIRMELIAKSWRLIADEEIGRMMKERGVWWLRRKLWVRELKKFGGPAADPRNRKQILTAP